LLLLLGLFRVYGLVLHVPHHELESVKGVVVMIITYGMAHMEASGRGGSGAALVTALRGHLRNLNGTA